MENISSRPLQPIQVVVAIFISAQGKILICKRPKGKPFEGFWEFPGGKVDPQDQSFEEALARESEEELGVKLHIEKVVPILKQPTNVNAQKFLLNFYLCFSWDKTPSPQEGQELSWVAPNHLKNYMLLPENKKVLNKILSNISTIKSKTSC